MQLDCADRKSTLTSLATIYSCAPDRIESFIHGWDIDEYWTKHAPDEPPEDLLQRKFEGDLGVSATPFGRACWFHGTRSLQSTSYSDGLLPLGLALPRVWETIQTVFANTRHATRLADMHVEGVNDSQFGWKTRNGDLDAGPFAMLVRDSLDSPKETGNWDYLGLGEIAADICNGYFNRYGERIDTQLKTALTPTVVKFWAPVDHDRSYWLTTPALYYLYLSTRGLPLVSKCNTCFDGKNKIVPATNIISVERAT